MLRSVPMLKQVSSLALIVAVVAAAALFLGRKITAPLEAPFAPTQALSDGKSPLRFLDSEDESDSKSVRGNNPGSTENENRQWLSGSLSETGHGTASSPDQVSVFVPKEAPSETSYYAITGEPESNSEDDSAELPIAGRVFSEWEDGISGVSVVATAQRLFSADRRGNFPRAPSKHRTRTDGAGFYEFLRLGAGDYEIRTEPTLRYPGARLRVRAGTQSADILLQEARALRVFGRVANTAGNPLAEALVQPISQGNSVVTDAMGNYALEISIGQQGESYAFDVSMTGYRDRRLGIRETEVRGLDEVRVDVQLEPVAATAAVGGVVTDIDGNPLKGAAVRLYSPGSKQSFLVATEHDGNFILPAVTVGDDYQLWVHADEYFSDYIEQPLSIPLQGMDLLVVLESVGITSLTGRMVDALGAPIPWLGLWLRSSDTAVTLGMINGDRDGYFHVEGLREGELSVQTRIPPYLTVNGIKLADGGGDLVELILDWGDLEIQGKVIDEQGHPVPGAEISVSWSLQNGSLHSRSSRRTTSGSDGGFEFSGLGPGVHALSVQALGFQGAWAEHDPLTDDRHILVELEEPPRRPTSD